MGAFRLQGRLLGTTPSVANHDCTVCHFPTSPPCPPPIPASMWSRPPSSSKRQMPSSPACSWTHSTATPSPTRTSSDTTRCVCARKVNWMGYPAHMHGRHMPNCQRCWPPGHMPSSGAPTGPRHARRSPKAVPCTLHEQVLEALALGEDPDQEVVDDTLPDETAFDAVADVIRAFKVGPWHRNTHARCVRMCMHCVRKWQDLHAWPWGPFARPGRVLGSWASASTAGPACLPVAAPVDRRAMSSLHSRRAHRQP